ncbi:MAG: shikimate kinase [Saprospiraceae bacterium]
MRHRIFLIGFMGSGKSTLGKILAEKLAFTFIDLDNVIEKLVGKTIPEIFSTSGELHFREIEQQALYQMISEQSVVIATGGGAPCFFDNMTWMNAQGTTIYLNCSVETLANRLKSEQGLRPLITGFDLEELKVFIRRKLDERSPVYHQCRLHVFDFNNVQETADLIVRALAIGQ